MKHYLKLSEMCKKPMLVFFCSMGLILTGCQLADSNELSKEQLKPIPFHKVSLEDTFWKTRLDIQSETLVPYALDKTIPAVENLEKAAKILQGDTTDLPFPHRFVSSDLYKAMEGAAYILMTNPDPDLEKRMDGIIDIIADAQKDDGYLYVAHITGVSEDHDHWGGGGMGDKPYSFLVHSHELYNMGHMYEAAIAYYQATGKDKWLKVAEKSAQHINRVIFEGDPNYNNGEPVNQAPGHQEIELALVKLYHVTDNELYLEMAYRFLEIRGITYIPEGEGVMAPAYAQQHKAVADQRNAVGHAVRAGYLYSGMADVSAAMGTDRYDKALDSIWHNIVDTKMHITGGLGAMHGFEGFGPEYILPNKEAYNETCAAVGNVFYNFRMFLKTGDAKYMDVAEVALLNNVLAGVNLEGNRFFYVNPLEADGDTPFNRGNVSYGRSAWFGTACCPTNLARLVPQISGMMYSHMNDEIFITYYASSSTTVPLPDGNVKLVQESDYPFSEQVIINVYPEYSQTFKMKLRIPTWAQGDQFIPGDLYSYKKSEKSRWKVSVNGKEGSVEIEDGFAVLEREWNPGDRIELFLKMDVKFNEANENIYADVNRIAITRGPLVYCAESLEDSNPVQKLFIEQIPGASDMISHQIDTGILKNIISVELPVSHINSQGSMDQKISLIPYYAWNNRGKGSMIVWFPTKKEQIFYYEGDRLIGGKFKSVKASSVERGGNLRAISDTWQPESSQDLSVMPWKSVRPWKSSSTEDDEPWIEVEVKKKSIRSIGVYWYTDLDRIIRPKGWSLEYRINDQWFSFEPRASDQYGIELDQYNTVHPESRLICDAIRINMLPQEYKSVGMLDVDVAYE